MWGQRSGPSISSGLILYCGRAADGLDIGQLVSRQRYGIDLGGGKARNFQVQIYPDFFE